MNFRICCSHQGPFPVARVFSRLPHCCTSTLPRDVAVSQRVSRLHWSLRSSGRGGIPLRHALSEIDEVEPFYGAPLRDSALPELRLKREVADMTVGLHTQFNTNLIGRVGATFPLLNADRRLMDSEIIVQLERRF